MRVGDIVKPIGKEELYLRIEHIADEGVYCSDLSEDTPNVVFKKTQITVVSCRSLRLPKKTIENVFLKRTDNVRHDATKQWMDVYIQPPYLIRLHDHENSIEVIAKVKKVSREAERLMYKLADVVRITLGDIICANVK